VPRGQVSGNISVLACRDWGDQRKISLVVLSEIWIVYVLNMCISPKLQLLPACSMQQAMSGAKVVLKNGTFYAWYILSASNGINAVKLLGSAHFLKQRSSEHSLSVIKRSFLVSVCLSCVKVKVYLAMPSRDVRGVEVKPHSCSSTLDGLEWSTLHHGRFTPGTEPR